MENQPIRFAQRGISSYFRGGEFAGRRIYDVAAGLKSGEIDPDTLPVRVIERGGVRYTLNNRSLMALRQAGIEPTNVIDVTEDEKFEKQLPDHLQEICAVGDDFLPVIRP